MEVIFSDAGYSGKCADKINERLGWQVEVVQKKKEIWLKEPSIETKKVFEVLKWRWIVERTFAWLGRSRRLSKDYEQYENTSETWILIAMSQLMLRRLA